MFELYTERARRVIFFARYEMSQLGGAAIETPHLLLGLLREGKGITSWLSTKEPLSFEETRQDVIRRCGSSERVSTSVEVPFSPESKRVLGHAALEAAGMRHDYIGTEHLLLGLIREEGSLAAVILAERGMRLASTREEILALLAESAGSRDGPSYPLCGGELGEAGPPPLRLTDIDRKYLRAMKITPEDD